MAGSDPSRRAATMPTAPASSRSMQPAPAHPQAKERNASGLEKCSCNASVEDEAPAARARKSRRFTIDLRLAPGVCVMTPDIAKLACHSILKAYHIANAADPSRLSET